jgi:RHS repeat-associated protein
MRVATVLQEDHYYPFGLQQSGMGYTNVALLNKYLYNGKEKQEQTGMYDYGFRQYDAVTGRWICVDKLAEKYSNTSPYVYCANDPVGKTDPNGLSWWSHLTGWVKERGKETENVRRFFLQDMTIGVVGLGYSGLGGFKGMIGYVDGYFSKSGSVFEKYGNGINEAKHRQNNQFKILNGQLKTDQNLSFGKRTWQLISRFTWESPQNGYGLALGLIGNTFGRVDNVDYYGGATTITHHKDFGGAFTLGSFIQGGPDLQADPNTSYFQHEYGHYLQSRFSGPIYLGRYALPSLSSAIKNDSNGHDNFEIEQDANLRAQAYWNQTIDGYSGWISSKNPINTDSQRIYPEWYDYLLMDLCHIFHHP